MVDEQAFTFPFKDTGHPIDDIDTGGQTLFDQLGADGLGLFNRIGSDINELYFHE